MVVKLVRLAGWAGVALLLLVTVSPIGIRPNSGYSPDLERVVALLALGIAFGFGYGRQVLMMTALVIGFALLFELGQHIFPNRHGTVHDAVLKSIAGAIGVFAGHVIWLFSVGRSR